MSFKTAKSKFLVRELALTVNLENVFLPDDADYLLRVGQLILANKTMHQREI